MVNEVSKRFSIKGVMPINIVFAAFYLYVWINKYTVGLICNAIRSTNMIQKPEEKKVL
jgi:hypothetical protein